MQRSAALSVPQQGTDDAVSLLRRTLGDSGGLCWTTGAPGAWGPMLAFPLLFPDWEQRSAPHLGGLSIRGGEAQEHGGGRLALIAEPSLP
jgi:hypothetical protein